MNKTFKLLINFRIKALEDNNDDNVQDREELYITGYANTTDKDRVGDVVLAEAWQKGGLDNFRANPIILAYHDHSKPIGLATELSVDPKGLKITARISKASGEVYSLIKEGILKAFSVSFYTKDADYDSTSSIFVIKDLELLEISVVSVPANQYSIFSVAKSFEDQEQYLEFKKQFTPNLTNTEAQDTDLANSSSEKENEGIITMDKEQIDKLVAEATNAAAVAAVAKGIELGKSGAERLLADAEKRLQDAEATNLKAVDDLRAALAEKATEIEALQKNKIQFQEKAAGEQVTYREKEAAVLLAKATNKDLTTTSLFQGLVQKYGAHVPSATWELEVSTAMQEEIKRALIVDPIFNKNISMNNPVMRLPVNPEAGYANWVLESGFKAATSSGTAQDHVLKEINLTAYKLATKEYLGVEEESDSLIPLLPIIRDAIIRRTAKAWDKALLRGAGAGSDPIKGIITTANTTLYTTAGGEQVQLAVASKATVAHLLSMRRALGTRGLNPSELVYIVSNEVYYDLLEDTNFQTMDKVGTRATLLSGQIGSIANTPVILSGEFEAKAATKFGAVIINQNNFLVGRYKGLRVESDYSVENQQRLIVASQRVGFQQISSVEGNGVCSFKWIA
jgi:HK97 family phage prohead protease